MLKRPLSEEEYTALKSLQTEVQTQPNYSTALPLYFVIQDKGEVETTTNHEDYRYYCFDLSETGSLTRSDIYPLLKTHGYLSHLPTDEQEELEDLLQEETHTPIIGDIEPYFDSMGLGITEYGVREEYQEVGNHVFVTEKEAQDHLKQYRYHYSPDARVYCRSGVYATNYKLLLTLLDAVDFRKLHPTPSVPGVPYEQDLSLRFPAELLPQLSYYGNGRYKVEGGLTRKDLLNFYNYVKGKVNVEALDLEDMEGDTVSSEPYVNLEEVLRDPTVRTYRLTVSYHVGGELYYISLYADGRILSKASKGSTEPLHYEAIDKVVGHILQSRT